MRNLPRLFLASMIVLLVVCGASAQNPVPPDQAWAEADKSFKLANTLMEQHKPGEALVHYKKALTLAPNEPAILFNGGMAAFATKDYVLAADLWKQLKALEPLDWHTRAKLVQTYQALGKTAERDSERGELFEMRKSGRSAELQKESEYCRDQFEVNGQKIMAFEHFELKGDRALRYVFSVVNKTEDGEEFRISLGSYEVTNSIWRETRNPRPKPDERLFHLDGYFQNGAHATFGMYFPEPSYDDVRAIVIKILEKKVNPISATIPSQPKPTPKP